MVYIWGGEKQWDLNISGDFKTYGHNDDYPEAPN